MAAGSSLAFSITVSSKRLTMRTSHPYSPASIVAVSASIFWLMVAITPRLISLLISSAGFMFIFFARSLTEIFSIISMDLGMAMALDSAFFLS